MANNWTDAYDRHRLIVRNQSLIIVISSAVPSTSSIFGIHGISVGVIIGADLKAYRN